MSKRNAMLHLTIGVERFFLPNVVTPVAISLSRSSVQRPPRVGLMYRPRIETFLHIFADHLAGINKP